MDTLTSYAEVAAKYSTIRDEYGHAYLVPGPFATFADIRDAHRRRGGHYFDTETSRFFRARYVEEVTAGRIFIDSVQAPGGRREYRAKVLALSGCGVETVRGADGELIEGATLDSVRRAVRRLLDSVGYTYPTHFHDTCPLSVAHAFRVRESLRNIPGVDMGPDTDIRSHGDYRGDGTAGFRFSADDDGDTRTHFHVIIGESEQTATIRRNAHRNDSGVELTVTLPIAAGVYDFASAILRARADARFLAGSAADAPNRDA